MKRLLKWLGIGLACLLGILLLSGAVVYGLTEKRLRKSYAVDPQPVSIPTDAAGIARGKRVATIRGCVECHTPTLGGQVFIDEPPIGLLYASNLTRGRGGIGAQYTDQDWVRAIRHGVGPDRKPLLFMPSHEYHVLSDADLGALIAYLKSAPPVDRVPTKNTVGPIGRVLFLKGDLPLVPAERIDHAAQRPPPPAPGPTVAYGAYLATTCTGCHGDGLSGGKIPGTPPDFAIPPNITADPATGIGKWTERDFVTAMRNGIRPDGRRLEPDMPWPLFSQMTDEELRALWLHLRAVPAKPFGNR